MTDTTFETLDLLDAELEDLAELERFTPIPAGSHICTLDWSFPDHESQVIVALKLTVVETAEMASMSEDAPEPGKTSMIRFALQNKDGTPIMTEKGGVNTFGQGQLREVLTMLQPTVGGSKTREIIENSQGATALVHLAVRASKKDPESKFNTIKGLDMA